MYHPALKNVRPQPPQTVECLGDAEDRLASAAKPEVNDRRSRALDPRGEVAAVSQRDNRVPDLGRI